MDKFNQRFGTAFTPAEQVKHFATLQNSVLDADTRLIGLAETGSRPTWDMLYQKAFQTGAGMALKHGSPSFRDLLATPDALDFLRTLMRENIWQQAVARRRDQRQGGRC
ncbi:hypothetical protein [uncultured Desulfovibrio sp.]|uniref:hypothetical protein n=1 Tax=uncultured Desulfovibrio sp. TaxID=167968 RepID=UPI00320AEA70